MKQFENNTIFILMNNFVFSFNFFNLKISIKSSLKLKIIQFITFLDKEEKNYIKII